ncbi:hypothetical protein B0A49_13208 [Cryomyces minteri]|uniref:Uncharacterized protein n=1 Tax=Cryomyces minteri TaxID=331657 RepID=A0A4U0UZH7_9PEZI|nr:hypothetical protein B0A49_13208 [Cryomyces minteri]
MVAKGNMAKIEEEQNVAASKPSLWTRRKSSPHESSPPKSSPQKSSPKESSPHKSSPRKPGTSERKGDQDETKARQTNKNKKSTVEDKGNQEFTENLHRIFKEESHNDPEHVFYKLNKCYEKGPNASSQTAKPASSLTMARAYNEASSRPYGTSSLPRSQRNVVKKGARTMTG